MADDKKEAFLQAVCDAQLKLGQAACGSIGAMAQATFGQVYRVQVDPGEEVSATMIEWFMNSLKISMRDFRKYEREFKEDEPRYNRRSTEFEHFARRGPPEASGKALTRALGYNTLRVRQTTANNVAKLQAAALVVATDGLRGAEKRMRQSDVIKYQHGNLLNFQSPNKKTRKRAFNGKSKTHKHNDTL
jgi:hypothetical protein